MTVDTPAHAHVWTVRGDVALCSDCPASRRLPFYQVQKRSERDIALMALFPDRAKRVFGWVSWPHTTAEVRAIRAWLETGDEEWLPDVYRDQEV